MKRDDDLLRQILLELEESKDWKLLLVQELNPSADEDQREYHVNLLCDAGLMVHHVKAMFRMTNQGHDYLEAIRSDTVWSRTKSGAAVVGGMTLGMMRDLAIVYLKEEVAKKLGIAL